MTFTTSASWSPIALSQFECRFTQITNSTTGENWIPSINADGARIAFWSTSDLTGGNGDGNFEIFLFDANAPAPGITQITDTTAGSNEWPSINADGTRIAFRSDRDLTGGNADGNFEIFLFDANNPGAGFTQITDTEGGGPFDTNIFPSINADGTRIAFDSSRDLTGGNADGNREIFLFDANAPAPGITQITDSAPGFGLYNGNLASSINADGTRIAFTSDRDLTGGNADRNPEIFLFDASAPAPGFTQITNTTGSYTTQDASINANGTRIAFGSDGDPTGGNADRNPEIFLFDANAPAPGMTQITNSTAGESYLPSINADGARIAFCSFSDLTGGNADGNYEIFRFDANAPAPGITQITDTTGESNGWPGSNEWPSINADGAHIAFMSDRDLTGGNGDGNFEIFLASCPAKLAGPPNLTLPEKGAFTCIEQSVSMVSALIDRQGCAATTGNYTLGGEVDYYGEGSCTIDDTTVSVQTLSDDMRGTHQFTFIKEFSGEIDDVDFFGLDGHFWYSGEGEIMYAYAFFKLCLNCLRPAPSGSGRPGAENYDEHVIKDFYGDVSRDDRFVLDQGLEVITKNNWPRMKFRQASRFRPPDGGIGSISIDKVSIAPSNAPQCFIRYDAEVDDFGGGIQFSGTVGVFPL